MKQTKKRSQWGIHISRQSNHGTEYLDIEFLFGRITNLQSEHYFAATRGDTTMANHWSTKIGEIGMSPVTPHHGEFLDRSYGDSRFTIRWFAANGTGTVGPQSWHSPSIIDATPSNEVADAIRKLMRLKKRQPGNQRDLPVEVALVGLKPIHVTRHDEAGLWLRTDFEVDLITSPAEKVNTPANLVLVPEPEEAAVH